jgi:tetratricopeptide (TPR) repeat protein
MTHRTTNRLISRREVPAITLLFLLCLCVTLAYSQRSDAFNDPLRGTTYTMPGYENRQGTNLQVTVLSDASKKLDRQSLVRLTSKQLMTANWQTTNELSEVIFGELPTGHYDVEVSAVGYLTAHKEVQIISSFVPIRLEITLQKDPEAINFNIEGALLPPKARKEAKRAVSALKSGKWDQADEQLEAAYKLAPSNADLNFLLGYLFYQKKNYRRASDFLGTATNFNPGNVQALTLLGRVGIEQEDYGRAVSSLEKAIVADADYWMAHDLLAASYLKQQKYEKARDQAQLAIAKGKGQAAASQLVLGQALVNLGQRQEGIQALKGFVETSPKNPSVPQVKALIAELESADAAARENGDKASLRLSKVEGVDPMVAAAEPTFSVRPWQPPAIDANKPSVAPGTTCPTEKVLQMAGARAQDLASDVSRIAAIEHLLHEQLDEIGDPITKETRTFNYVATISESAPMGVAVEEYRAEHLGLADFPDHIASSGFAALALVFHPAMRDNFEMICEGLGEWQGQATWLVHFRQRDDRPARMNDFKVGSEDYALKLKGRAWITADKFQIVRIESELVNPLPKIRLAGEHQVVEYGPVPFAKKGLQLWLPKSAEIYLDFRRHRYYRKHSFDHYMLFSTDASEKRKAPPAPEVDSKPLPN